MFLLKQWVVKVNNEVIPGTQCYIICRVGDIYLYNRQFNIYNNNVSIYVLIESMNYDS